MYESSTKETKWVCIQLACSRRPRAFWGSPSLEYTSQVLKWNFPLVYDRTKRETLYHEDHGATLKHKCGKRIVTLSLLSFSLIFLGLFSFFMASFFIFILFFVRSLIPTCGGIIVSIILSSLGQCSNNDDHHTFIFLTTQQLQLDT